MGIFLISVALLLIGVVIGVIFWRKYIFGLWATGVLLAIVGSICVLTCGLTAGATQFTKSTEYHKAMYEKSVLEYRQESEYADTYGNEMLYSDIVEFNNNLREVKTWANNFWTNWYNNDLIATIDYIEIQGAVYERQPHFAIDKEK